MIIQTTKGTLDDAQLEKHETDGVVEYYLNGALVHRSVVMPLSGAQLHAQHQSFVSHKGERV